MTTPPPSMPQSTLAFDEAVERVRQGGGRVTKARRELLADLYDHGGRITADTSIGSRRAGRRAVR